MSGFKLYLAVVALFGAFTVTVVVPAVNEVIEGIQNSLTINR